MTTFPHQPKIIIYILHSGNLYGTERMALATLEGMSEYETRVVVAPKASASASVTDVARSLGYRTVTFHTRWQLYKGILPWFLRHRSIDVIDVGVGSSLICHFLGRALLVRLRQLQVTHGGTADGHAYGSKHLLNRVHLINVAVSDFVKQKLLAHRVRPDAIQVIENFLAESQRLEAIQRAPYAGVPGVARPIDQDRVRIAVVSRVDAIKKIDLLVDAVAKFGLSSFQFDIYGTGEQLVSLKQRAAPLSNVCFHGYVSDVKDRLGEADILLHLCPEEPFGLVILEAFASRLVVVVPDAGGAGSLVEHGVTGLRFQADDVDDLSRTLHSARSISAAGLQRMADAGTAALDARFAQTRGIDCYREALKAAGAARSKPVEPLP